MSSGEKPERGFVSSQGHGALPANGMLSAFQLATPSTERHGSTALSASMDPEDRDHISLSEMRRRDRAPLRRVRGQVSARGRGNTK